MLYLSKFVVNFITDIANKECITDFKINAEMREFTGDNFLGEIVKVNLIGKQNNEQKSFPFIVKKSPENEETRKCMDVKGYYKTEVFFYEEILPAFEQLQDKYGLEIYERFQYPKYYGSSLQELKEVVILRDHSYEGYIMHDRRETLDNNHMVLVVQNLARIHALSFVMKEQNPELFDKLINGVPHEDNYGDFLADIMEKCVKKIIPKLKIEENRVTVQKIFKNLREIREKCLDAKQTHPYNVLCHGDAFINNFLFMYEDSLVSDLMLVDWQLGRFASPVTDLSYTICFSTNQSTRQKHLSSLLNLYYNTLGSNMKKMGQDVQKSYPRHVFEQQLKNVSRFGLIFSIMGIAYLLKKPGEERKVEEIADELKNGELDVEFNDEVIERLEGLLTDFTSLGYI